MDIRKKISLISNKKKAVITLLSVFVISFFLFYRYIFQLNTSDFPAHIKRSLQGRGYSINLLLFPLCYKLTGSYLGIVILMALFITTTVFVTALFFKKTAKLYGTDRDLYELIPLSASLLFICKLCIPEFSPYYYKTALSTQPWHNSTYIEMRLFAIPALMMYFVIRTDYLKKISIKECVLFTLALTLTNISKPNYVIVFAPVMLVVLIIDFIRSKGKSFKNAFVFGFGVLISCFILLFQYKVMFPSEGESGVAFSVANAISYLSRDRKFIFYYLLNFLFPIYVTYLFIRNRKKADRVSLLLVRESWAMNIMSLLVSLFIIETGPRQLDGNFEWGNAFFAYALFAVCILILEKMKKDDMISEGEYATAKNIYTAHVVFGIFYFLMLLIGYLSWII